MSAAFSEALTESARGKPSSTGFIRHQPFTVCRQLAPVPSLGLFIRLLLDSGYRLTRSDKMAPSLPGTSGRRTTAKGSSSSTIKREARSSRATSKQDSDSEDQSRGSPSGSRRPTRKNSSRSKARSVTQDIEDEDKDESDDDGEGTVEEGLGESSEPPEDLEEIEGEIDEAGETKVTKNGELLGGRTWISALWFYASLPLMTGSAN